MRRNVLPVFRTPINRHTGKPTLGIPAGWASTRSGLWVSHAAGSRKVYVSCQADNCDTCEHNHHCKDVGCMSCKDRHYILEWNESTRFAVNQRPVKEPEWGERLSEGIDRIIRKRELEGF